MSTTDELVLLPEPVRRTLDIHRQAATEIRAKQHSLHDPRASSNTPGWCESFISTSEKIRRGLRNHCDSWQRSADSMAEFTRTVEEADSTAIRSLPAKGH